MATIKKRGSVAIDTVPLPERSVKGGIIIDGAKFILKVNQQSIEIPVGVWITRAEIQKFVGKEVAVYYSATKSSDIVAIGTWPTPERVGIRTRRILCYIPAPDIMGRINPAIRTAIIREMVREKVISTRLATDLRRK
jgi:hypothetical protein